MEKEEGKSSSIDISGQLLSVLVFRPIRFSFENRLENLQVFLLRLMYKCAECKLKMLLLLRSILRAPRRWPP